MALQKSQVSQELEQVHSAIADLEEQLVLARKDNERLRKVSAHAGALSGSPGSGNAKGGVRGDVPVKSSRSGKTSGTSVHVSRRGSISITRAGAKGGSKKPVRAPQSSSASASRGVKVKTHRSGSVDISSGDRDEDTDLVGKQGEPWSLGTSSAVSSIRRGTYFGTYTQAQANSKRTRQRTRSIDGRSSISDTFGERYGKVI